MQPNLQEAERRIAEARSTRGDSMDLGDLCLRELPASIEDLPELRALYLGKRCPTQAGCVEWDFSRRYSPLFTDLSRVAGLRGLQSLDLAHTGVTDLSSLAALHALQSLNLRDTDVTDLTPLAGLQRLQTLELQSTNVSDLSPLAGLSGLRRLYLHHTGKTDLSPLAGLQKFEGLYLWSTGGANLSQLANLNGFQMLYLTGRSGVKDLSALEGLQGLRGLDLTSISVSDLSPLSGCQGLQELCLADTGVTDLSPLADCQGLWGLALGRTTVRDLSPLEGLQSLRHLELPYTNVTDLTPLGGCQGLQVLDLMGTGVADLRPLADCHKLRSLDLRGTRVWDLSPLANLQHLEILDPGGVLQHARKENLGRPVRERDESLGAGRSTLSRDIVGYHLEDCDINVEGQLGFPAAETGCPSGAASLAAGTPVVKIALDPLTDNETGREVFISYAWGDETPAGTKRSEVVDRLVAALAEDGFRPVRDRDEIKPGERISAFMRRLTRSDLVVAVISDAYLHSPACMYEIYRLWQAAQGDAHDLARRVVPIVMPEVRIGSVRERLPFLEYWAGEAETLEAVIRNPRIRPGRESWEEVRLVREFAHTVDDILVFLKDVLMPRRLEVHLDEGFEAVREALRRRLRDDG